MFIQIEEGIVINSDYITEIKQVRDDEYKVLLTYPVAVWQSHNDPVVSPWQQKAYTINSNQAKRLIGLLGSLDIS